MPRRTFVPDEPLEIDAEEIRTELRELLLGGHARMTGVNLRDLGFIGRVSDEARAEIAANERRALNVITTAHLYWFT